MANGEQQGEDPVMGLFGGPPEIATRTDIVERLLASGRKLVERDDNEDRNQETRTPARS